MTEKTLTPEELDQMERLAKAAKGAPDRGPWAGDDVLLSKEELALLDAEGFDEALHDLILSLVAMARRAPRWIPVEERMPADTGEWSEGVLVAVGQLGEDQIVVEATLFRPEGREPFWLNSSRAARVAPVTHWQPLPEPPERER